MAYWLHPDKSIPSDMRRIIREQVHSACQDLDQPDRVEAIHEARKRLKKIRAALRLVRPAIGEAYARENHRFRDMARPLAGTRDDHVLVETFDKLLDARSADIDRRRYVGLRPKLVARREQGTTEAIGEQIEALKQDLSAADDAIRRLAFERKDFGAIRAGLEQTYQRGRDGWRDARQAPAATTLHEWRKQIKYHRYHCDLLSDLWPAPISSRESELHRLSDLLGDEHDLTVLGQTLLEADGLAMANQEQLLALINHRRTELKRAALPLGQRLFHPKRKAIGRHFQTCWKARQTELDNGA
ncbi:CHAD domain-containing protein [Salinisphaera sp. SPP-AMP-43]|uniref:CHAD domain-containing protein n=1 Tax=Salinisphaera sp. SPP-AMP-43 TaxID=3121288 RepID=UPI003C6E06F8